MPETKKPDPMILYRQQEYSKVLGEVTNFLNKFMPKIPTVTPQETQQAWGNVVTQSPEYALPFAPNIDVYQLAKGLYGSATNLLGGQPGMEFIQPLSIRAFHGSPYKFSKFSSEKIGTGEGAQVFGYGHYLSESPEVARFYSHNAFRTRNTLLQTLLKDYQMDLEKVKTTINKNIDDITKAGHEPTRWLEAKKELEQYSPHIYETTIHKGKEPSEYTYLEWDKPVTKDITEKIDKALELRYEGISPEIVAVTKYKLRPGVYRGGYRNDTIKDLYDTLVSIMGSEKEASSFLMDAGFSGIKYPTGTLSSRAYHVIKRDRTSDIWWVRDPNDKVIKEFSGSNAQKLANDYLEKVQEYNYVVFNPEDITIESVK